MDIISKDQCKHYVRLGEERMRCKKHTEAANAFNTAMKWCNKYTPGVEKCDMSCTISYYRAECFMQLKHYEFALADNKAALKLADKAGFNLAARKRTLHWQRMTLEYLTRNFKKALTTIKMCESGSATYFAQRALIHMEIGMLREARADLARAIELNPAIATNPGVIACTSKINRFAAELALAEDRAQEVAARLLAEEPVAKKKKKFKAPASVAAPNTPPQGEASCSRGEASCSQGEASSAHLVRDDADIEDILTCPISLERFVDPVAAADGHTYERSHIEDWLRKHDTSPLTNELLAHKRLIPNRNIMSFMQLQ